MVSEAKEPGSESGKRSDDRRGAARGTRAGSWSPQEGGASNHSAARLPPRSPGSFAAAAMVTRPASYGSLHGAQPRHGAGAGDRGGGARLGAAHGPGRRDGGGRGGERGHAHGRRW